MATLRELRRRRLLTQQELAQAVGVRKYQTVHYWELGRAYPRPAHQRKLCEALGVTPDELLAALDQTVAEGTVTGAGRLAHPGARRAARTGDDGEVSR